MLSRVNEGISVFFGWCLLAFMAAIATVIIVPFLLIVYLITIIVAIPQIAGGKFSFEEFALRGLDKVIGIDEMRKARDEMIMVFYCHLDLKTSPPVDDWYLIRLTEVGSESVFKKLRSGESLVAFVLGIVTILIATSPVHASILTGVVIVLTILVAFRVAATRILSFPAPPPELDEYQDLQLKARWNYGPNRKRGVILMVFFSLLLSVATRLSPDVYNLAMKKLDWVVAYRAGTDYRKWHGQSDSMA